MLPFFMKKYPHYKVLVRLKSSKIHGVGVFAIQNIKKGQYIFYGDDEDMVWVKKNVIKNLSKELKKLYLDFCVLKDGKFGCPSNFNDLKPAWYLNHSDRPNIAADKNYNFYALRNIKKGEELTSNYKTYSEY